MRVAEIPWKYAQHNLTEHIPDTLYYYRFKQNPEDETEVRITVLNRLTGYGEYGEYVRDTETGYTDENGKFWLASGMFDIREYPELSLLEAIVLIKQNANTLEGVQMGMN